MQQRAGVSMHFPSISDAAGVFAVTFHVSAETFAFIKLCFCKVLGHIFNLRPSVKPLIQSLVPALLSQNSIHLNNVKKI